MNIEQKRRKILKVLDYKDGDYYIGSMQLCAVNRILRIGYPGDTKLSIKYINNEKINEVYQELKKDIKYMNKNPKKKCSTCGSIVDA